MKHPFVPTVLAAAILGFVPALAQEPRVPQAAEAIRGDARVVDFHLPKEFDEALRAARAAQRPLVVKGVAFGVDELGATCATKGHW